MPMVVLELGTRGGWLLSEVCLCRREWHLGGSALPYASGSCGESMAMSVASPRFEV